MSVSTAMTSAWVVFMAFALLTAFGIAPRARMFPIVASIAGLGLSIVQLALDVRRDMEGAGSIGTQIMDVERVLDVPSSEVRRRALIFAMWLVGFCITIWLIGFIPGTLLYLLMYLWLVARGSSTTILVYLAVTLSIVILIFHYALRLPWPAGLIEWPQDVILELLG